MTKEENLEDIKEIICEKIEQFGLSEDIFSEWEEEDSCRYYWYANYSYDWDEEDRKIKILIFEVVKQAKESLRRKDLYAAQAFILDVSSQIRHLGDLYLDIANDIIRLLDERVSIRKWPELPEGYKAETYDISDDQKAGLNDFLTKMRKDQKLEYIKELIYERIDKFELSRDILEKWDSEYSINWDDEEKRLKMIAFESVKQLKIAVKRGDIYAEQWFINLVHKNMENLGNFYSNISEDVFKILNENVVGDQWLELPERYKVPSTYDIPDDLKRALGMLPPIFNNSNSFEGNPKDEVKKEYATKRELRKLESFLIKEIEGERKETFFYKLHEEDFLDKSKLDNLFNKSYKYLEVSDRSSENYVTIVKGLVDKFLYIMFTLFLSNDPEKFLKIKNYHGAINDEDVSPEEVSYEYISDMHDKMREIIWKIK